MIAKTILTRTSNPTTHTSLLLGDIDFKTAKSLARKILFVSGQLAK
jgi:hypothetical protein